MKLVNKLIQIIISLSFVFVFSACASSSSDSSASGGSSSSAAAPVSFGVADSNSYYDGAMQTIVEEAEDYSDQVASQEKLVYTGYLTIETLNYSETIASIREYIAGFNGIIEHEDEYDDDYSWYSSDYQRRRATKYMNLTVRIPTEHFDTFMNEMEGTGKVRSRSTNVANITQSYNDTSARIESLETQQRRLLDMMASAESIEDMIAIEARLSEVETELKQAETSRRRMDTDVEYSTITLDIREVMEYTPDTASSNSSFLKRLGQTWVSAWKGFVRFLQNFVLFLIEILPYLIILVPLGYLLVRLHRKWKESRPERKRERKRLFRKKEAPEE